LSFEDQKRKMAASMDRLETDITRGTHGVDGKSRTPHRNYGENKKVIKIAIKFRVLLLGVFTEESRRIQH